MMHSVIPAVFRPNVSTFAQFWNMLEIPPCHDMVCLHCLPMLGLPFGLVGNLCAAVKFVAACVRLA